ncbi:ABC transporter substrate-binding protein [Tianweitania sp. BSSL-BM11]|uniref:ABC transporter substrate-binding protein n=1 Tax=Tianweitania aestuarii TaxID=2814886 RepID=A0ABS5RT46_9HYPH|nr:ABC transporter substrate-binding protein [Tianweitania aestuarii]MBS9720223.1 ABC transporter substrate-binding protein [Tianweitania aestuarii]
MTARILLAFSALSLVLGANTASAQDKTLTISVYGIAQDAYKAALYDPFEAKCGCKIVVESGTASERLAKLEVNAAAPTVDVIAFSDANALEAANKDLLAPIDTAKVPNLGEIYDFAKDPLGNGMGVGYTFYGTSIVYRSDLVKIDSWLDLFKPELAGQIALPNITGTQGPITLFMLQKAIGKEDPTFSDAIDLVAEHKDDVVTFYNSGSQLIQLLQQEEVVASVTGRFTWPSLMKLGMPVAWATPKEGQTGGMNVLSIVKGAKDPELAQQFIDYWLSAEVQQKLADGLVDSPVNTKVTLPDDKAEMLTYGADSAESINFLPPAQQLENRDAWLQNWNSKVAN